METILQFTCCTLYPEELSLCLVQGRMNYNCLNWMLEGSANHNWLIETQTRLFILKYF